MVIKCTCTKALQTLLKRSIKADKCSSLCEYKPECNKPKDMTCGEYIVSLIKWELEEEE